MYLHYWHNANCISQSAQSEHFYKIKSKLDQIIHSAVQLWIWYSWKYLFRSRHITNLSYRWIFSFILIVIRNELCFHFRFLKKKLKKREEIFFKGSWTKKIMMEIKERRNKKHIKYEWGKLKYIYIYERRNNKLKCA